MNLSLYDVLNPYPHCLFFQLIKVSAQHEISSKESGQYKAQALAKEKALEVGTYSLTVLRLFSAFPAVFR